MKISCDRACHLVYHCCVATNVLKKSVCQKLDSPRSLLERLDLLSRWSSERNKIDKCEKQEYCINFQKLPSDVKDLMNEINDGKSSLTPFTIHLEFSNIERLMGNDIIAVAVIFSKGSHGYEIKEYFFQTLNENIYTVTKLFASGIPRYDGIPETAQQDQEQTSPPEYQQVCIVCHSNPVTRAILPCRHACVCKTCFHKLNEQCPVCRKRIESFFPVRDESFLPRTEDEERDYVSTEIRNMGWWEFLKSVWNAG